ncbi:energy-coupling factor transporter ATPase [Texcoconibacillus texcoconensis]|uniref:Energy-coupling factor transporter ATP-binding protein EcfA2 n=1 Tax=Texcoconibacillus texcoconensis TaxID=1095777 RepID=A0A840QU85_9BACI|nr:energy-coupling factor transporter ATPase [Texcoconibacillus texcoconensis]MBB5174955.1 energy-coupling factor transport system ATP-binding protein [Texcoconibacillus texcoconensis]
MDIKAEKLTHIYMSGSPFESKALHEVDLSIASGEYVSIIGHTGSGKSTLVQHFNGLVKPTSGSVQVGNWTLKHDTKQKVIHPMRRKVGMVFQFPEHQLFDETVESDVAFGPINHGVPKDEALKRARRAIEQVGLPQEVCSRSPFDLSGGQMRRAAIAGVLVMNPEVLILDEPTAGIDPQGQKELMDMIEAWRQDYEATVILVTHDMELAAKHSDRLIIMSEGQVAKSGSPPTVFADEQKLQSLGLQLPESLRLWKAVQEHFGKEGDSLPFGETALVEHIDGMLKGSTLGDV